MFTLLGGGHIIFAFSGVRHPPSVVTLGFRSFQGKVFILSLPNVVYMGVYWVNSLHGIAFGEDSSIAS